MKKKDKSHKIIKKRYFFIFYDIFESLLYTIVLYATVLYATVLYATVLVCR